MLGSARRRPRRRRPARAVLPLCLPPSLPLPAEVRAMLGQGARGVHAVAWDDLCACWGWRDWCASLGADARTSVLYAHHGGLVVVTPQGRA